MRLPPFLVLDEVVDLRVHDGERREAPFAHRLHGARRGRVGEGQEEGVFQEIGEVRGVELGVVRGGGFIGEVGCRGGDGIILIIYFVLININVFIKYIYIL